jgi:hypothetical protein
LQKRASPSGVLERRTFPVTVNNADNDNKPTYRLTFVDAIEVWLRHWSGQFQHHIAAHFGVNPGRVNEVLKGHKFLGSREDAEKQFKASA